MDAPRQGPSAQPVTGAHSASKADRWPSLAGAGLLAATGGIHLDLYLTGYRFIHTIGPLFLLQVLSAFVLALAVATVALTATGSRLRGLVVAAGAGFSVLTLGGYLLSLWVGLFGFREIRTTAGIVAGVIEAAAFALLAAVALGPAATAVSPRLGWRPPKAFGAAGAAGAAMLIVLGVSVAAGNSGAGSASKTGPVTGAHVTIVIKNFAFHPSHVTVTAGETIAVKNEDSTTHTLTAGPLSDAGSFNTGNVAPGRTVVIHAPAKSGTYGFYCVFHHFMTGLLRVT